MDFSKAQSVLRSHRNVVVFGALVLLVAGLDLLLNPLEPGRVEILSIPLLASAILLLALVFLPEVRKVPPGEVEETLAHRLLTKLTLGGKLIPLFPLAGLIVIALDVVYNALISSTPSLQIHDTVVIMFGLSLVAYPFVPQRYDRERDFILIFFLMLVLILVVPLMAVRVAQGDFDSGINSYSSVMLAPELQALMRLIGIPSNLFTDAVTGAPGLEFTTRTGQQVSVVISTACSGIYSFAIFASAFTAFVLTEFKGVNKRVWALLILGFVAAYFANLLRMTVIVASGYFSDTSEGALNAMLIAHSNAGWLIFLGWISLFWLLMYRFLFPKKESEKPAKRREARCVLCNESLSPTIPGVRCECGNMYHLACVQDNKECPRCSRILAVPDVEVKSGA